MTATPTRRPRLLILSFSPLRSDARVLKQVRLMTPLYEVTTCGYGDAPDGVAHHVRVPDTLLAWRLDRALLIARRHEAAQATQEVVAWCRQHLAPGTWDAVLANDVETVPLALWLQPAGGVHADLHEYSPRLKENLPRWRAFVAPYARWLCRTYVTRADSATTVAQGLADAYEREHGVVAQVVTNATPYRDATPTPVPAATDPTAPLRLVHSGAALPDRHLDLMVEAMRHTRRPATLDLYLTRADPQVIDSLRALAATLPDGRVRVLDPVPYEDLVETLAGYDVGVFTLPPSTFSYRHALPNKLFDYVQARLAVVVSPGPEMAALVQQHHLGAVTRDHTVQALAQALDDLDPAAVQAGKEASHTAARALSAQEQSGPWLDAVARLMGRAAATDPTIALPDPDTGSTPSSQEG